MSEINTSNSLFISVLEDNEESSKYYYFSKNTSSLLKFFGTSTRIEYSPSSLTYGLVYQEYGEEKILSGAEITRIVEGYDKEGVAFKEEYLFTQTGQKTSYSFPGSLSSVEQKVNITKITLSAIYNGKQVAYEELPVLYGTNEAMAKFALKADGVYMSMQEAGLVFDASGLTINNGGFTIKNTTDGEVFKIDENGNLYYKGEINSSSGLLAGWTLTENELIDSKERVGIHSGTTRFYSSNDNSPVRFWAGASGTSSETMLISDVPLYSFAVTENGTLYATDAQIIGSIEATTGRILNSFYVGQDNTSGIIIHGDNGENSYIGSMQYASGSLGGGWIVRADGSAEFNNVSVRGKITSSVFEQKHISSVGGSLYIAPTIYTINNSSIIEKNGDSYTTSWALDTILEEAFGGLILEVGDYLLIDGNVIIETINENSEISYELIQMTNISLIVSGTEVGAGFDYPNILKVNFSSSNEINGTAYFQPGAAIVFYGKANERNGLYLTAMGENAPYLEIYSTDNNNQVIPAVRLGNLSGIIDSFFGVDANLKGYGLYSNNAYLRGQLMLPNAGITNQNEIKKGDSAIRLWAGKDSLDTIDQANFIVTENGALYAKRGVFEGIVKAENSEFSGNIRAAGILLEQNNSVENNTLHDHFYVAYNILENGEFIPSYKNYLLNIDADGLSIWEGGLQAYSDYANGELPNGTFQEAQPAWEAYSANGGNNALPFLYLVDEGTKEELTSRIVVNKIHTLNFNPQTDNTDNYYQISSVILDNGLWFENYNPIIDSSIDCKTIESTIFSKTDKQVGLFLSNEILHERNSLLFTITNKTGYTLLETSKDSGLGVFITSNKNDINDYYDSKLFIRGKLQLIGNNDEDEAKINIGNSIISEVRDSSGKTIGLDFSAMS